MTGVAHQNQLTVDLIFPLLLHLHLVAKGWLVWLIHSLGGLTAVHKTHQSSGPLPENFLGHQVIGHDLFHLVHDYLLLQELLLFHLLTDHQVHLVGG